MKTLNVSEKLSRKFTDSQNQLLDYVNGKMLSNPDIEALIGGMENT
jgi:hypothetical protein